MAKAFEKDSQHNREAARGKRPYLSPRLIEYGAITKLTATNGTILPQDNKTGSMNGGCL
jgi:hypothetical protein